MCQYIETFHEYNGCRLRETYPNGKPSRLAWFLGIVGRGPANGDDGEPESTDADAEQAQEPPECHKITERLILQCEDATTDPEQQDKPIGERVCKDPVPYASEEQQPIIESGYTTHGGECPVCRAVKEVIEQKTDTVVIRGLQVAKAQRQQSPNGPRKRERTNDGRDPAHPIRHGGDGVRMVKKRYPKSSKKRRGKKTVQSQHPLCCLM